MALYSPSAKVISISVTSATVPCVVVPPGFKSGGWVLRARTGNAVAAWVWAYQGATPSSVPTAASAGVTGDTIGNYAAGVYELAAGNTLNDNLASASSGMDAGLSDGWVAVLSTGVTAVILDLIYR